MASFKKLAPWLALGATGAIAVGGFFFYRHLETKDRTDREQRFADLSACLMGRTVTTDAEALEDFSSLEAWTMYRPAEMRGKSQGGAWPDRCVDQARAMSDQVRDSAFIEKETKVALLDAIGILSDDLAAQEKARTSCAGDVASLWRKATDLNVGMAASSTVKGPVRPSRMEGAAEMPFVAFLPIEGGPEWIYLLEKKEPGSPIGFCNATPQGLSCKNLAGDAHVQGAGSWESPSFIPLLGNGKLELLHDGAISELEVKGAILDAYADAEGTVYAIASDRSGEAQLVMKPLGKKAVTVSLKDSIFSIPSLSALPAESAESARFVGKNLIVGDASHLYRLPIGAGAKLGDPVSIDAPKMAFGNVCRSGPSFFVSFPGPDPVALRVNDKLETQRVAYKGNMRCGTSGEFWDFSGRECNESGCHDPLAPGLRERLPPSMSVGLAGDKVVTAWLVPAGRGMVGRVTSDGEVSDSPDVVISPKTDVEERQRVAIFGGPLGAIALAETKRGLIGAHVSKEGKFEPLLVDWK